MILVKFQALSMFIAILCFLRPFPLQLSAPKLEAEPAAHWLQVYKLFYFSLSEHKINSGTRNEVHSSFRCIFTTYNISMIFQRISACTFWTFLRPVSLVIQVFTYLLYPWIHGPHPPLYPLALASNVCHAHLIWLMSSLQFCGPYQLICF